MKKLIIKIDRFILDQLTIYIQKWIKKNDYQKHKIDFLIQTQWVDLYLLVLCCIVLQSIFAVLQGKIFLAIAGTFVWGLIGGVNYAFILFSIKFRKPHHDQLFAMRKNPAYYNIYKEIMEEKFIKYANYA